MIKITLTSGLVGKTEKHRKVVKALGLRKYGSSVVRADSPTIRGMVNKVHHLVTVEPASGSEGKKAESNQPAKKEKVASKAKP